MASLIAFVSIFVESPYMDDVVQALSRLDKVVDLYEVTGEFDIVTVVSASDIEEFRDVLKNKIMKVKGVKSTVSSIVLKTHKGSGSNGDILNSTSAVAASYSHRK
jgi:DNA-binding Lrp family transcriptional regulator